MKTVSITFRDNASHVLQMCAQIHLRNCLSLVVCYPQVAKTSWTQYQSWTEYRVQQTHKQGFLVSNSSYCFNYSMSVQSITGIPSTHLAMYPVCIQEPEANKSVFSYIADIIFEDSHARTAFSTQTIAVVKFCQILQCDNSTMTMLNHLCQCDRSTHSGVPITCDIYACFMCYDRTCSWQGYHKFNTRAVTVISKIAPALM